MDGHSKLVVGLCVSQSITILGQVFYIPGQCGRIAADIDYFFGRYLKDCSQQFGVAALSGRIHHDYICVDIFLTNQFRNNLLCSSRKEFRMLNIIQLRIFCENCTLRLRAEHIGFVVDVKIHGRLRYGGGTIGRSGFRIARFIRQRGDRANGKREDKCEQKRQNPPHAR